MFRDRRHAGELLAARLAAIGQFYQDFSQTTDEEVREMLATNAG